MIRFTRRGEERQCNEHCTFCARCYQASGREVCSRQCRHYDPRDDDLDVHYVAVHQFVGPSPHAMQQTPLPWDNFLAMLDRGELTFGWSTPELFTTWPEDATLDWATTVYRRNPETGMTEIWRTRWDSSG